MHDPPIYWQHLDTGTVFRLTAYGYQRWDADAQTWVRVGVHPGMQRDYYIYATRGGDAFRLKPAELDAKGVLVSAPVIDSTA